MDEIPGEKNCTVREDSECESCTLGCSLHCKWDKRILNGFVAIASTPFVGTLIMLVLIRFLTGHWWPLVLYIVLIIIIFGYEFRFLCSHCPYYEGEGKSLKCLGNNGAPKIYKYNPAPMTGWEKFMMKFLVGFFYVIVPLIVSAAAIWLTYTGKYGTVALAAVSGLFILLICTCAVLFQVLKTYYCSKCVNFSCPLNSVDKRIVDDYLMKNDVMREAWERSGYKPG